MKGTSDCDNTRQNYRENKGILFIYLLSKFARKLVLLELLWLVTNKSYYLHGKLLLVKFAWVQEAFH